MTSSGPSSSPTRWPDWPTRSAFSRGPAPRPLPHEVPRPRLTARSRQPSPGWRGALSCVGSDLVRLDLGAGPVAAARSGQSVLAGVGLRLPLSPPGGGGAGDRHTRADLVTVTLGAVMPWDGRPPAPAVAPCPSSPAGTLAGRGNSTGPCP